MGLYANGIKFDRPMQLKEEELSHLMRRYKTQFQMYRRHFRIGLFVFYACLLAIALELIYSVLPVDRFPDSAFFVFILCCLLPPVAGSIQEIIFPASKRSRFLFSAIYSLVLLAIVAPTTYGSIVAGTALLAAILGGWIMILLRWFDAKKYLPIVSEALQDIATGTAHRYAEVNEEGEELISLEILGNSHLVYRANGQDVKNLEIAAVMEIADGKAQQFLAPWYHAPKRSDANGPIFLQRKITKEELIELTDLCNRLKRKAFISIVPSLYFSAVGVRLVENLLVGSLNPELSVGGWGVALIMALYFPARWLFRWIRLRKDLNAKQILSAWTKDQYGNKDTLLEEVLSESGLLWSQYGRPSYWRVSKFL